MSEIWLSQWQRHYGISTLPYYFLSIYKVLNHLHRRGLTLGFCFHIVFMNGSVDFMEWTSHQASVRAQVKGRSQVIKTEVRAMNAQEARWLLWAQFGFHSIQAGPSKLNVK